MDFNLKHAVYRWVKQSVGADEAEAFRAQLGSFAYDPERADVAEQFVDDVKSSGCDTMVWHFYQDARKGGAPGDATGYLALPRYRQYLDARFGGPSWNNEWGNRSLHVWGEAQAEIDIRNLVGAFRGLGIEMAVAYGSGQGENHPDQLWLRSADEMGEPTPEGRVAIDAIQNPP
jgi:hypothetical protein